MELTNKHNLPAIWVNAVKEINSKYSKGEADYSVTQLLKPVKQSILQSRHFKDIEPEDVADQTWRIFGQLVHSVLEAVNMPMAMKEYRLYSDVLSKRISGQVDLYYNQILTDFKVTSAWTIVYKDRFREWEEQVNMYAYLLRSNLFTVDKVEVLAVLRDWSNKNYGNDYPDKNVVLIDLTLWSYEKQQEFVWNKVNDYRYNEEQEGRNLRNCSDEEMWATKHKWAVRKKANKKASKVCNSEQEANLYLDECEKPTQYVIEHRPSDRPRCKEYCSVNKFCNQHKEWMNEKTDSN